MNRSAEHIAKQEENDGGLDDREDQQLGGADDSQEIALGHPEQVPEKDSRKLTEPGWMLNRRTARSLIFPPPERSSRYSPYGSRRRWPGEGKEHVIERRAPDP